MTLGLKSQVRNSEPVRQKLGVRYMATPLLKQGSRGAEVRQLQQFLKDKGYYKGTVEPNKSEQTVESNEDVEAQ